MHDNEVSRSPATSRRRLLKACAVTVGVGLLGVQGTQVAVGDGADAGGDGAPPAQGIKQSGALAAADFGSTSYNGWTVGTPSSVIGVRNFTVPGTSVILPIRSGDVATVLMYVAQRFNAEVERILNGQCWGYAYRANVNNPGVWSNHASGTAIDLNSLKHPNGAASTFTSAKIAAVRQILAFCGDVVYWGQDYRGVVDGMHFEIDVPPGNFAMTRLVAKIRGGNPNYPGVASYLDADGVRHVFGISPGGKLQELTITPGAGGWQTLDASNGGYVLGTPALTYRNGRCDIYAIGGDAAAWTQHRTDGGRWSGWTSMGGANLAGGLDAVIDLAGARHVFCVTTAGALWQYLGSTEAGWGLQDISNRGILVGTPAAMTRDGRYDVFGIGLDGAIWQMTYVVGDPGWSPWRRVGGSNLVDGLAALADSNGRYRVIGVDTAGKVRQFTSANGLSWTQRDASNGGTVTGAPSMTFGAGRVDVFAVGTDSRVWLQSSVNSGPWSAWQPIGGSIG